MNLGVVIGYGVSETKEMAQNWRGADMFCVILCDCDCDCNVWCVCDCDCIYIFEFEFEFESFLFPVP